MLLSRWAAVTRIISQHTSSTWTPTRRSYATTGPREYDDGWQVIIGLEIHAQLRTRRKLFSRAQLSYGEEVNTHVEQLDAAVPGSLPVLDLEAIRLCVLTALALQCDIWPPVVGVFELNSQNPRSTFDRKHYFYHDIPASYQITQHYNPLARSGALQISRGDNGSTRDLNVRIQQLQVEQDTAKSQLVGQDRLIDLNRAGTGLMEIVTDPDMRSAEEAGAFVRKLQSLLRRVGSGDGDMEKGNLRVDVNISVHRPGTPFGTRCEIKNLNSVRFLQQAIEYERKRHIEHYTTCDGPLPQETRTMNELTGETMLMRRKEEAEDYRYMPDSNLPAVVIKPGYLDRLRDEVPELPWDTVNRISTLYGVPKREVETLMSLDEYGAEGVEYLEAITQGDVKLGKRALNWVAHEMLGQLNKINKPWTPDTVPATLNRELVLAVEKGKLTGTNAKVVLKHLIDNPSSASTSLKDILAQLQMATSDSVDLRALCEESLAALPDIADSLRKGQMKAMGRVIGEVMRRSGGAADAKQASKVIMEIVKR